MSPEEFYQWCSSTERAPLIMGVLNVTPNSFSDGGDFLDPHNAYERALEMIDQGVDIIDIGGESTNPGTPAVSCQEELDRVIPVIKKIRAKINICLSIDTSKAQVMKAAVEAGANMINDIQALRGPDSLSMASMLNVPVCLMHMQGTPITMQDNPNYPEGVVHTIHQFFLNRIEACLQANIPRHHLILDPGFGFGKTNEHNVTIIKQLSEFSRYQLPLLLGTSRKNTIGSILNKKPLERVIGGLALSVVALLQGISIIRTHDINETKQVMTMLQVIKA